MATADGGAVAEGAALAITSETTPHPNSEAGGLSTAAAVSE